MSEPPHRPTDDPDGTARRPTEPSYGQPIPGDSTYGQPAASDQPTYGQPTSAGYVPPGTRRPGQGLAITALVLGILGLLGSWIAFIGALLGLVAVVLGFIAVRRAAGKGMAIAGIVLGGIALILGVVFTIGWFLAYNLGQDCLAETGVSSGPEFEQCLERELTS